GPRYPAALRDDRGTQGSVVQKCLSSIGTADPTSTDPSGGPGESLRSTWRAASTPSLSPPSKPTSGTGDEPTGKRFGPSGGKPTTWSEPSTTSPSEPEPSPATP